jgi:hypothetical protein
MISFKPAIRPIDQEIASHKQKSEEILAQGPLLPMYQGNRSLDRPLTAKPLKVYDTQGSEVKLSFETSGFFTRSKTGLTERIFYDEIRAAKLLPILSNEEYMQVVIDTAFGVRMYYFVPRAYTKVLSTILPRCGVAPEMFQRSYRR